MSQILIDESKHKPERTFLQKLRDLFIGMVFGALIVQLVLFWVPTRWLSARSIFLLFDSPLFLVYLAVCGIFGWVYGSNFTDWLSAKIIDWWF